MEPRGAGAFPLFVDSQSVKGAGTPSPPPPADTTEPRRSMVASRISWSTRIGPSLVVMVTAASVQDRDGGERILERLHGALGSVRQAFRRRWISGRAPRARQALSRGSLWQIRQENRRADSASRCSPRRWVVERTFSWLHALPGAWYVTPPVGPRPTK